MQQKATAMLSNGKSGRKSSTPTKRAAATAPKPRRRGRRVRVPPIVDAVPKALNQSAAPDIPGDNYRVILRRRAVRKGSDNGSEDDGGQKAPKIDHDGKTGDISLGMKFIVRGGFVIVQNLNPLSDGRASPAQLVGVIKRGDILLAVDDHSLVNLSLDQLKEALGPFNRPDSNGVYRECLDLRFSTSRGIELLRTYEEAQMRTEAEQSSAEAHDASGGMFSMSMINSMHLFSNSQEHDSISQSDYEASVASMSNDTQGDAKSVSDLSISRAIANQTQADRKRVESEFFTMGNRHPRWLRKASSPEYTKYTTEAETDMIHDELAEKGLKMLKIAKQFSYDIEMIDKGKDMRSFQRWTSSISLRSRASVRRRRMLDSVSLPTYRFDREKEKEKENSISDDESGISEGSESLEGVDGDELLLGLAANDEIWQRQVVEALNKATEEMNGQNTDEQSEDTDELGDTNENIDSALTAFLFGKNMTQIITKKKKSHALPPEEVTSVLFDLTTNIASSAPDEITIFDQTQMNPGSRAQWTMQSKRKEMMAARNNVILATRFVLDIALPIWLESFRPLPLEQRRVLWPRMARSSADSHAGNSISDDSLTIDSMGSGLSSPTKGPRDLREVIEDQQLDIETRAETCFLTTFYFTQRLLPLYAGEGEKLESTERDKQVVNFVEKYGSYLQMHACLSYAAVVKAQVVIGALLDVAQYDLNHKDALSEIQSRRLVLYDSTKLSAVVKSMQAIRHLKKAEHQTKILNLCVAAYPDIQPWQFKAACASEGEMSVDHSLNEPLSNLYYDYISHLLHPTDGYDGARHDAGLVKEWCELSIDTAGLKRQPFKEKRYKNFVAVVTKPATYSRDLRMLLRMSMDINRDSLVLDLCTEIINDKNLVTIEDAVRDVVGALHKLSKSTLRRDIDEGGFDKVKRILRLLRVLHTSPGCEIAQVPNELHFMVSRWNDNVEKLLEASHVLRLTRFMTDESSVPTDVIESYIMWADHDEFGQILYEGLRHALERGVAEELHREISGSLLRLKYARSGPDDNRAEKSSSEEVVSSNYKPWDGLLEGSIVIDKY